ncbi:SIR2 family protein [Agromyces sp. NPDC127015]|uniref:SIR2 family protein n=1 Tax=Agromyces sp. NPDC127015 TaxID=3347108 RepID=UPI00364C89FC
MSAATSGGAPTSTWAGLIRSGADRAQALNPSLGTQWRALVDGSLDYGATNTVIQAAGMVATEIRARGDHAFNGWLAEDIGELQIKNDGVATALAAYPFPILTTNYDTLLESATGRKSADWTDLRAFQDVVTRGSDAIGHLHGIWSTPTSVVLTESDYAQFGSHESIQALERAVSTLKSIVYVGFGAGLSDPNFASLLDWHRSKFPDSTVIHYRLCLLSEHAELTRIHANDHVAPVVYGEKYEDLAAFLRLHVPSRSDLVINGAGLARDVVQEARDRLWESMTAESVLVEASGGDLVQAELVVPPVLLPVPHASFVRDRMQNGPRSEVAHLDGYAEVQSHDFFVVVGDEGSGLSTAVKWLATQSSELLGSAAPIFVRFVDCRSRREPLLSAVTTAAMSAGVLFDRKDVLPPHVLAIDDFDPTKRRAADAVLAQIAHSPAIVKIVGCGQGNEDEIVGGLRSLGVEPRILYVGRMRRSDIAALADKLAPGRGSQLAAEALRILDGEGLKRTPMTVSLLLFLLLRGGAREATDQTEMLDAYLSILLGVGDPHHDGTGLTDSDLQAILSNMAESMIRDEKPSLPEHDAVRAIAEVMDKYGWSAVPSDVLNLLVQRRILRRHRSAVEFGRYAYFTLFAAKRAVVDPNFRALIVKDIFYYAPLATRIASLTPTDEDLLKRLVPLLDEELKDETSPGSPYERVPLLAVNTAPENKTSHSATAVAESTLDDLEFPESDSPGSFGLVKADMSATARMNRTLRLVSSVLRDLDQVERLDIKRDLLTKTLEVWGRLITALSTDSSLADVKEALTRGLISGGADTDDETRREWIEFLARSVPAGTVLSGIESTLISPKLQATLREALRRNELSATPECTTATLFFLFLMRSDGWAVSATALVERATPTWVLTHFFRALCEDAYRRGASPESELMELCRALFVMDQAFASPDLRAAHLDVYSRQLRNLRAKERHSTTHEEGVA